MTDANHYLGNPLLKKANVPVEWTEEQILEYKKCMEDPMYFCVKYIKIVSLDEGLIPLICFHFKKRWWEQFTTTDLRYVSYQDSLVRQPRLYPISYTTFYSIPT